MFFVVNFSLANILSIESENGSLTGKYFCLFTGHVRINGENNDPYAGCDYTVEYNSSDIEFTGKFPNISNPWWDTNPIKSHYSPKTSNGHVGFSCSQSRDGQIVGRNVSSLLLFTGVNTGITSTNLKLVDNNWNNFSSFDAESQSDGLSVLLLFDTLKGTSGLTVNFEACPCVIDNEAPIVYLTGLSSKFEGTLQARRITGINNFNLLVYDYASASAKKWDYWFNGNSTKDNTTYVKIDTSKYYLDNQEGVDSGKLKVTIKYGDPAYSGRVDDVFTGTRLSPMSYTGTLKNGSKSITKDTWDGNDRGYRINFTNTSGFLVEKEVKIIIEAEDNNFNLGSICKKTNKKHLTGEYTINTKTDPEIEWIYPKDLSSSINPNLTVSMKISDDWAGIDTGSLVMDVIYPECTGSAEDETFECTTKTSTLSSGNFFTGGMFELTGGSEGLGNSGSYVVTFTLSDLPTETGIILSGYVEDLAGNHTGSQITFYTRMPCSTFGCRDSFKVSWLGWDGNIGNIEFPKGTGSVVILVTGSNNISFAGDGNSELMCGSQREQAYLTGNIKMFDSEGNLIIGDYNITDYNDEGVNSTGIYLTGLDVRYDGDTSELVIDD